MLSIASKTIMPGVIMMSVVMLSVLAPINVWFSLIPKNDVIYLRPCTDASSSRHETRVQCFKTFLYIIY